MTRPTKLIEFGDGRHRLVRINPGFTVLEVHDGTDWLGVARWKCATRHEQTRTKFRSITLSGETESHEWIRGDWVRELLNHLGDEMLRQRKNPRRGKRGKRGRR